MKALVTGATGFIGRHLVRSLEKPVVLSRSPERATRALGSDVRAFAWDTAEGPPVAESLEDVTAVFHLAGEPVAEGRWTTERRRRIVASRVEGTRHLVEAMAARETRPDVLVSASAVGYYGSAGDRELDESSPAGDDFLAEVSTVWEREAVAATELGVRVVVLRIGVVIGRGGGALGKMLPPFKLGLGARLGSGAQWVPWIHVSDVVGLMLFVAARDDVSGPVNATAPHPVTNRELTKTLGAAIGRPTVFAAPELALRIMLGGFAGVLLSSQRVMPKVALDRGYEFRYPEIEPALRDAVRPTAS